MGGRDETAGSYKMTADLLISRRGDKSHIIDYLFRAADMYTKEDPIKSIECLDEISGYLRGSVTEFGNTQYFRYLHQLARSYEDLLEEEKAADVYLELANEIYKKQELLFDEDPYSYLKNMKKFSAYLAKTLLLYDSAGRYDSILKLARTYYKRFPLLQENDHIKGELFFCYEHIINAADQTGSRYFREYYAELDKKLRQGQF
jgi:hypothetical protein